MITIFTDGATEGPNGKFGTVKFCGIGFYCQDIKFSFTRRIPANSNNEAEFYALLTAMKWALLQGYKNVRFQLDSMIVVKRAKGNRPYGKFANQRMDRLQDILMDLKRQFDQVEFRWIPRYQNQIADTLSKQSLYPKTHI